MTFNGILYKIVDEVATITFNRPEVSNGFNIPMCEEILEAIELAANDEAVKFLVINANGKVFSVGGDLAEMQRAVSADDIQSLVKIAELVNDISFAMKRLPIQAFVGVGLAPDAGGLYLLTRAIGVTRATHLVMTGEALTAEKALDYGLLYKVCEAEKLEKTTEQLLKKLKRGSLNSYRAMKEMVWKSLFSGWKEYAELELSLQKSLAFTEDFKEGVQAYTEKRRPQFTGK